MPQAGSDARLITLLKRAFSFWVSACCGYKPLKLIDTGDFPAEEHWPEEVFSRTENHKL